MVEFNSFKNILSIASIFFGFFGFWGAFVLLIATIALGIAIVSDLEALGALLGENVSVLWERLRSRRDSEEESALEFEDVVGVPETEGGAYEPEEADTPPVQPEYEPVVTVFNRGTGSRTGPGIANFDAEYEAPPLSILSVDRGRPGVGDIKANANVIKRTLENFGIDVEMGEVSMDVSGENTPGTCFLFSNHREYLRCPI